MSFSSFYLMLDIKDSFSSLLLFNYLGNNPKFKRRRWDSNPRAREGKTISSRSRYDHFDTSPYSV